PEERRGQVGHEEQEREPLQGAERAHRDGQREVAREGGRDGGGAQERHVRGAAQEGRREPQGEPAGREEEPYREQDDVRGRRGDGAPRGDEHGQEEADGDLRRAGREPQGGAHGSLQIASTICTSGTSDFSVRSTPSVMVIVLMWQPWHAPERATRTSPSSSRHSTRWM